MIRTKHLELSRAARLGNLGTLSCRAGTMFDWYLTNVYDVRFPRIGADKHFGWPRQFDTLRHSTAVRLKWRRQSEYVAHVKQCPRCKGVHHEFKECLR